MRSEDLFYIRDPATIIKKETMPKTLRPYQQAAIKAIWQHVYKSQGYPLIVAPVGAGKSLIIAEFIRQVHDKFPRTKIIVLAHNKELLKQNADELRLQYPEAHYGFYCAGLGQKRLTQDITFASIQSIYDKINDLDATRRPSVILIDEVHLVPHNDDTRYRKFISDCEALNPKLKVIGLTGTPYRSDSGHLCEGKNALFASVSYEIQIAWMIENGFLCRPIVPQVTTQMDTSGVQTRNGDYIEAQLQAAIDKQDVTESCVNEIIELGKDRKRWLIFTAGTDHCEHVATEIRSRGISCLAIHSKQSKEDNNAAIDAFRKGNIQCLVNVAMLTTGFNVPEIDLLAFMRPTRSPVLYVQCIGRGIRPVYAAGLPLDTKEQRLEAIAASGKIDCMVLDFGGVIDALGQIDNIRVSKGQSFEPKPKDEKKPQARICPACGEPNAMEAKHCHVCNHQLIADVVTLSETADKKSALLAADVKPETLSVIDWTLSSHKKNAETKPVLRVMYHTYAGNISEWVCFDHPRGSWVHDKAKAWHDRHMPEYKGCYPNSVKEALHWHKENATPYKIPQKIIAKKPGKYWEFISAVFEQEAPTETPHADAESQ